MSEKNGAISPARLISALVPIAIIALAVRYMLPTFEQAAQEQLETNMLTKLLGSNQVQPDKVIDFVDSDGDLVRDFVVDDEAVTPEKLIFTYVGGAEEIDESQTWADLIAALGEATGVPVEYKHFKNVSSQLEAMIAGELHLAGLNTGAVPLAVKAAGFQPVCTLGKTNGDFGYTMKLLVPANGAEGPEQLQGKQIAFTTPTSNSGFKAALVYLMAEHNLRPERDYDWSFTFGHETSVNGLIAGDHDAAPVASDILERLIAEGEVEEDAFTVIYESERFPPATIGYAYNLASPLREKIAETLLNFEWEGTSVAAKYGSSGAERFVPVSFKNDWANIRRIDEAVEAAKQ